MSRVRLERMTFDMADLPQCSPLPDLHDVAYVHSFAECDDTLTAEDTRYMRYGRVRSILPYLSQSRYDRARGKREMDAVVLENEHVRAVFLPWLGARLWSLTADGRALLSENPVVQPCDLALRNAWCSGGTEWNVSLRGHSPHTCDTVFAERFSLPDGTACARFYEYERIRGVVWRVEAWLPPESRFLFTAVHIENPAGNGEAPMYWWSNIAVPETRGMRVLAPARTAVLSLYDAGRYRMLRTPLPLYEGADLSAPCAIPRSVDVFFDIPEGTRPFIAALPPDGRGFIHTSTAPLTGRKLFVWGMGQGGRHWQKWLSDGHTRYVEIQAGIARTQQDHLPMPDGAVWSWLEAYGPIACGPEGGYAAAAARCADALERALPAAEMRRELEIRAQAVSRAHGDLIVRGSGWGALENARRTSAGLPPVSAVCAFPADTLGEEQAPWHALLKTGRYDEDMTAFPKAYMTAAPWQTMLERAPETAAALYHRAVILHTQGRAREAAALLEKSVSVTDGAPAERALARIAAQAGDADAALRRYDRAIALAPDVPELRLEHVNTLLTFGRAEDALRAIDALPGNVRDLARAKLLRAAALVRTGRGQEALALYLNENDPLTVPDMREGELSLSETWLELYAAADGVSRAEAERRHPVPEAFDFRMHG